MFATPAPYVQIIEEPKISFDLDKVKTVYDNYTSNCHAGLTMVIGHPFCDHAFLASIEKEQEVIKSVFKAHDLSDLLVLYDVNTQVHATLLNWPASMTRKETTSKF